MQGKTAKKLVFGSNFVTYGAPFYKWCRFTYGAVTHVVFDLVLSLHVRTIYNATLITKHLMVTKPRLDALR